MNHIRSEFGLKISTDQFYEIKHTCQTVHWIELKLYREILDIWKYILINFQVKLSSGKYYFIGSNLLD
jgi:hypothetical protein